MGNLKIKETASYIQHKIKDKPNLGLILGSGLGVLAEEIENPVIIPYDEIPHFPKSTVSGHKGQLVVGMLEDQVVLAMQGRFHYYEGYSMDHVSFPVRVMQQLGIQTLIVTNASGGINKAFKPGDLMIITDHINQMGDNPLIGPNDDTHGPRFPDMTQIYNEMLIEHAETCALALGLDVQTGVYVGNAGPMYETPAEVKMLRTMGADAVGMSTVPEAIVAAHTGMRVLGISCISNMAAGILPDALSHEEVMATTESIKNDFLHYLKKIIHTLPK